MSWFGLPTFAAACHPIPRHGRERLSKGCTTGKTALSEARRRVTSAGSGARRARFAADLGAEALEVGDPHHRQAEAVRPLYDQVHVMLSRRDVVALRVEALVGHRLGRLAFAQRGDAYLESLVNAGFLARDVHLAHDLEVQHGQVGLLEVEEDT